MKRNFFLKGGSPQCSRKVLGCLVIILMVRVGVSIAQAAAVGDAEKPGDVSTV
jgi:hypothetical protein